MSEQLKYLFPTLLLFTLLVAMSGQASALEKDSQGNVEPSKVKNFKGKVGLQIPAGIYSREDLLKIASAKKSKLRKVFESIDWMHSGKLASMDSGLGHKYTPPLVIGFNEDAAELKIAYEMRYKNEGNLHVMLATWNIRNKQLQQLIVLTSRDRLLAVSSDQQWLAMKDDRAYFKGRGLVRLYNIETNAISSIKIKKVKKYEDDIESANFSPDGRYIAVKFLKRYKKSGGGIDLGVSNNYLNIFQTTAGNKLVATHSKAFERSTSGASITFSPDSSKFLLNWRCSICGDEEAGVAENRVGSTETGSSTLLASFKGKYGKPVFSADSRYLVELGQAYDTQSDEDIKGYKRCEGGLTYFGFPVLGSPLNLGYTLSEKVRFKFNVILDGACVRVGTHKHSVSELSHRDRFVFSQDNKQFALMRENEAEIYVLKLGSIQLPGDEEIASAIDRHQAKKIEDDIYKQAQKAFNAGFYEQALAMVNDLIEKHATSPSHSAGLDVAYITSWAKKLPLVEVGKSLLRKYELHLAQPVIVADGFKGGDESVDKGFIASVILPDGTAEKAGMKTGDIVMAVDGVAVKDEDDYKVRLKKYQVDDVIALSVLRGNKQIELPLTLKEGRKRIYNAAVYLTTYGMIASAAGHPELTKQAAEKLHLLIQKYSSSMNSLKVNNYVIELETLALASQGNSDAAYKHAVQKGGLVQGSKLVLRNHINDSNDNIFLTPLYQDRKKLAYLLGIAESDLPKTPTHVFPSQAYPDLDGNIIGAGKIPVKKKEVEFEFID